MRRKTLIGFAAACATIAGAMSFSIHIVHGQSATVARDDDHDRPEPVPVKAIYNPYPPGILPIDLDLGLARVLREVKVVEARALARWQALTPPTLGNQPPILENTGTDAIEILGELMNYDHNISPKRNVACASCHMPYVAFSGPIPSVNLTMIAYPGSAHFRAGKRTEMRYTYSNYFPPLLSEP